jgi:hypothetical protein
MPLQILVNSLYWLRPVYTVGYQMGHPMGYTMVLGGTSRKLRTFRGVTEYHGISYGMSQGTSQCVNGPLVTKFGEFRSCFFFVLFFLHPDVDDAADGLEDEAKVDREAADPAAAADVLPATLAVHLREHSRQKFCCKPWLMAVLG